MQATAIEVSLGWTVWERCAGDYEPRGGTVVESGRMPDPETGELSSCWTVVKPWRGELKWVTLREDQVDLFHASPPNSSSIKTLVSALCRGTAKRYGKTSQRDIAAAYKLSALIDP